jgi:23S rRNA pseudouridine2605 synthase
MRERIQKVLANAGLGSRRQIEDWIRAGRITVDGAVAKLGDRITTETPVNIDGRPVKLVKSLSKKTRVLIYNKPEGEICTRSDPENRPTVFSHLPLLRNSRWIAVGRLDINTQGLILFTNNGELANKLMHPRAELEREYAVRVHGTVSPHTLQELRRGVKLEDGMGHFEQITEAGGEGTNRWYNVIVKEGRNRLVRRLWESQNVQISRLMRVRFGSITLPRGLHRGQWQELEPDAVQNLLASFGE